MMLIPESMRKVNIFLAHDQIEETVNALVQHEILHVVDEERYSWQEESREWTELADKYSEQTDRLNRVSDLFDLPMKPQFQLEEFTPLQDGEYIKKWLDEATSDAEHWQQRKDDLEERIEFLETFRHELQTVGSLDIPLQEIRNPDFLHWVVGTIPEENLETLRIALSSRRYQYPVSHEKRTEKMYMFIPGEQNVEIANVLAQLNGFQVIDAEQEGWSSSDFDWGEYQAEYEEQKLRIQNIARFLQISLPEKPLHEQVNPVGELEQIQKTLGKIEQDISEWQDNNEAVHNKIDKAENLIDSYQKLSDLDITLSSLQNRRFLVWDIGILPVRNLDSVQLTTSDLPVTLIPIKEQENHLLMFAATSEEREDDFQQMLRGIGFESLEIPVVGEKTPHDELKQFEQQLHEYHGKFDQLVKEKAELAERWSNKISVLWQQILNSLEVTSTLSKFARSENVLVMAGKVTGQSVESIMPAIQTAAGDEVDFELLKTKRGEHEVFLPCLWNGVLSVPLRFFRRTCRLL